MHVLEYMTILYLLLPLGTKKRVVQFFKNTPFDYILYKFISKINLLLTSITVHTVFTMRYAKT